MPRNSECRLCPAYLEAKHVCLWGEGPAQAEGMVVGQNPGHDEDRRGRPFVGRSGKLLERLMATAGLSRDDYYVSNAVKCHTTDNKEPKPKMVSACSPYLVEEVSYVQPKVILALGNTALRALTGRSGITQYRGSLDALHQRFPSNARVLATYHPAAAARSPHLEAAIVEDLRKFKAALTGGFVEIPIQWRYWQPGDIGPSTDSYWVYDTETNMQLDPRNPGFAFTGMGIDDGELVWLFEPHHVRRALDSIAYQQRNYGLQVVGFNSIGFDDSVTEAGIMSDDVMLMDYLLNEEGNHKLETLATAYLGVEPWKAGEEKNNPVYIARDCRYTRLLFDRVSERLRADDALHRLYERCLKPAGRALAKVHRRGVYIAKDRLEQARGEIGGEVDRLRGRLVALAAAEGLPNLNPNAYGQVGKLLFDRLGMTPVEWTDEGHPSTAEGPVKQLRLSNPHPVLDLLLAYRKNNKLLTSYIIPLGDIADADPTGRYRCCFNYWLLTVTGRTSAERIQTIPHDPRVRSVVAAPPGRVLVMADYHAAEMRATAHLSGDAAMLAMFAAGEDPHTRLARIVLGKEHITPEERWRMKPTNFVCLYAGEAYTLQQTALKDYDIFMSMAECESHRSAFFGLYPGLPAYYKSVCEDLDANGRVRNPLGRTRRLPSVYASDESTRIEAYRQAINFKAQSFASDWLMLALREADREGLETVAEIHDQLIFECDEQDAKRVAETAKRIMEERVPEILKSEFDVALRVPLKAEVIIDTHWR